MPVKTAQLCSAEFITTVNGVPTAPSAGPTAELILNGIHNAAVVTVYTNLDHTGTYRWSVTMPTLAAGDIVQIRIAATVGGISSVTAIVWIDSADTKRVSDLNDIAAGAQMDFVNAPNSTAVTAIQSGLATSANQTTILARLGSWTGTGINNILGAIRALAAKATALTPTDLTTDTTFNNVTDSLEAVSEAAATISGKTTNLPASPAAVGSAMTLATGAITAAVVATGAIDADALAADAAAEIADAVWDEAVAGHTTASTFGEMLGDVDAEIWTYATRTLTSTAVATTAAVAGSTLTIVRSVTYDGTISGLTIPATWTKAFLTIKASETLADSAALVQLMVTNPASTLDDGLLILNGAAGEHGNGSLTVTQAAGTVRIVIADDATALLSKQSGLVYDVKVLVPTSTSQQLTAGACNISDAVTLAIT